MMEEESRQKNQAGLESCRSGERKDKEQNQDPALRAKPRWPRGLRLPPSKDVTCFIPGNLAVILSHEAFEELFGYAYSSTSEICCPGTVKQEGERFRIQEFHLVPQSGSAGHTELDQDALAALVEELLRQGKAEEARSLKCWAHSPRLHRAHITDSRSSCAYERVSSQVPMAILLRAPVFPCYSSEKTTDAAIARRGMVHATTPSDTVACKLAGLSNPGA